jgi:phosphatidylserine/phosphatidylglycerophosphate/cardiolipin synthase-like enzyme
MLTEIVLILNGPQDLIEHKFHLEPRFTDPSEIVFSRSSAFKKETVKIMKIFNPTALSVLSVAFLLGCAQPNTPQTSQSTESLQNEGRELSETGSSKEPTMELVQSVPTETKLAEPGIRYAKEVWLDLIQNAKRTLDIEQMYVSNDEKEALEPIIQAIKAAGERGVKVRLILAKQMLKNDPATLARFQTMKNLSLAIMDLGALTTGIQHAKMWIADNEKVFVGSQNLDWKALTEIHELGILIQNKNTAARANAIFETDWEVAKTGKLPTPETLKVAPLSDTKGLELVASPEVINPKNVGKALNSLLGMIQKAQKKIQIQVMEYSTFSGSEQWLEIDNALRAAAGRGVSVEFVVSHWNQEKPEINSVKELAKVPNIQMRICEVPAKSTGFIPYARVIHSKFMIVDEKTLWVSTSNWTKGYFSATRNVDFVIQNPKMLQQAGGIFERVWNAPYTNPVDPNKEYPLPQKG